MPYAPPLIKPPLPPLRPPAPFPYRPPGTNRLPPTQPAPIYQPPDLLPPTDRDLKGKICIYSNAPVWELKKIRYRYPGESWQEIAGDHYSCQTVLGGYGKTSRVWISGIVKQCFRHNIVWNFTESGPINVTGKILGVYLDYLPGYSGSLFTTLYFLLETRPNTFSISPIVSSTLRLSENSCYTENPFSPFADTIDKSTNNVQISRHEGETQFEFKVFDISNQEILSITRDVCPEVIVVPERCYFRPENERLVGRWIVGFLDPPLRIEYEGHCASVWRDYHLFSLLIFKECSDNPNCPPPRIRFDKKCEEKCEQCPSGTALKVLLGGNIACVDSVGCVKKMIKYKPGCNSYDCICG
jgi:hypothetical protein